MEVQDSGAGCNIASHHKDTHWKRDYIIKYYWVEVRATKGHESSVTLHHKAIDYKMYLALKITKNNTWGSFVYCSKEVHLTPLQQNPLVLSYTHQQNQIIGSGKHKFSTKALSHQTL